MRDLGTVNGTEVNGNVVEQVQLRSGDSIGCGKFDILFQPSSAQLEKLERDSRQVGHDKDAGGHGTLYLSEEEMASVKESLKKAKAAHFRPVDAYGKHTGSPIPLKRRITVMGRGAEIALRGWFIRPDHAIVTRNGDRYTIAHQSGLRRVFVNGSAVRVVTLQHEDLVKIGDSRYKFFDAV